MSNSTDSGKHTPGPLTEPLMTLLVDAPETVAFLVQDAIRAVAAGNWALASRLMSSAAELEGYAGNWFERAGRASDELAAIAKATGSAA